MKSTVACFVLTLLIIAEVRAPDPRLSRANDCRDINAPASSCYDYFMLVIYWAPGYMYREALNSKPVRDVIVKEWSIHGLWPAMFSGGNLLLPDCNRHNLNFNKNVLGSVLIEQLNRHWFSIIKGKDPNTSFWKREFEKHGRCATRAATINTMKNYFAKSVELFKTLSIDTTLHNAGYKEGNTEELGKIMNIIKTTTGGKRVIVNYVKKVNTNQNYLSEVRICYDLELKNIDCPNSYRNPNQLKTKVTYVNNVVIPRQ